MDGVSTRGPLQVRDALLMLVALEGKDFQAARKELADQAEDLAPPSDPPSFESLDIVEFQHVEVTLQTPDVQIHVEATRLEAVSLRRGNQQAPKDPLVLDLDGDGPETTGRTGARSFDLEGNGVIAPTSFVSGGDAFLALDRNGNGQIDSGLELFGDQHGAANGYAELARFDGNDDGRIDASDSVFGDLRLLYGDGTQRTLASQGILSLDLGYTSRGSTLANGDLVYGQSVATRSDGSQLKTYALGLQRFDLEA